jgi:hypothetical protein
MKSRINSLLSLILLIYFAGFAVAPVSAVLPAEQPADIGGARDSLEKRSNQTDVFLYDLALWEILTKVKRSDRSKEVIAAAQRGNNDNQKDDFSPIAAALMGSGGIPPLPNAAISKYISTRISIVCQRAYFYRTGLAPPFVV